VTQSTTAWPEAELERIGSCPACGSRERDLLHSDLIDPVYSAPGRWTQWRCRRCASLYLDPRPNESSIGRAYEAYFTHVAADPHEAGVAGLRDTLVNGYLNARYGYRRDPSSSVGRLLGLVPGWPARQDKLIRHLTPPAPAPRVLDVGCGNGDFVAKANALGWEGQGVEPDRAAVDLARAAGLAVDVGDITDVARGPGFDAITLSHVIEHLHRPLAAMERARELLRPGGMVWIATPNARALGHRVYGRHWFGLDPPRHLVVFTPDSLMDLLRAAGFTRVSRLRAPTDARWLFGPSEEIASGRKPRGMQPPRSAGGRLKARLATVEAMLRPERAEELLVAAWTAT
jgi:SAM-dependent methyltransferase